MTTLINSNGQMEIFIDFPRFKTHAIAASWRCQSCGGKLDPSDAKQNGYPPGRGSWAIRCAKCDFSLFYDLPLEIDHSSNCASKSRPALRLRGSLTTLAPCGKIHHRNQSALVDVGAIQTIEEIEVIMGIIKYEITLADLREANRKTTFGQSNPMLRCQVCGNTHSANPGDYFMAAEDYIFTCCDEPMRLVRKVVSYQDVEL